MRVRIYIVMMRTLLALTAFYVAAVGFAAADDRLSGSNLVEALRAGGYKIYFRHAQTDWSNPDQLEEEGDWLSCDTARMRQLSNAGRETARRIGAALRALNIPVGNVISSEYCRSVETARLMNLGPVQTTRDIMNTRAAHLMGGHEAVTERAREVFRKPTPAGQNIVIVGHGNLMRAATGEYVDEAGAGVYALGPDTALGFNTVAILTPADWEFLAARYGGRP